MVNKAFPTDLIDQAKANLESWKKISATLVFGELTQSALGADLAQADQLDARMKALEAEMTDLRKQRDALHLVIWDELKRLRASIDNIDAAVVHMLAERFKATKAVGELKAANNLPPADKAREAEQIARLRKLAHDADLDPDFAEKFLAFIVTEVIRHHEKLQGKG